MQISMNIGIPSSVSVPEYIVMVLKIQLNNILPTINPNNPPYSIDFLMEWLGTTKNNGISENHISQGFICSKAIPVNRPEINTRIIPTYLFCNNKLSFKIFINKVNRF